MVYVFLSVLLLIIVYCIKNKQELLCNHEWSLIKDGNIVDIDWGGRPKGCYFIDRCNKCSKYKQKKY